MEEARRWYVQRPRRLPPRDQAFLDAVLALGRRGQVVRKAALAVSVVVLALIATGATVAYVRISSAQQLAQQNATDKILEASKARNALEQLLEKERQAAAAAERQARAEAEARAARDEVKVRDADLKTKDADLQSKNADLQLSREQLQILFIDARSAREKAEQASARAVEATLAQRRISAQLEAALAAERVKNERLEHEKSKLSTELKQ